MLPACISMEAGARPALDAQLYRLTEIHAAFAAATAKAGRRIFFAGARKLWCA